MIELINTVFIDVLNELLSLNWSSSFLQLETQYNLFYHLELEPEEEYHWTAYIPAIIISLAMLGFIFFVIFKVFKEALGFGTFSSFFKITLDNKRYAYKVIGSHLVLAERGNEREQFKYLITYLRNRFPELGAVDSSELHRLAYLYRDITKPLKWLNDKLLKDDKIRVIDFMVDLAFFNGRLNKRELHIIYLAGEILEIPEKEVRSILSIRQNHYRQKAEREQEKNDKRKRSSSSTNLLTKKNTSLKVLGLAQNVSSFHDVRKAYRALARKHHPDRYVRASKAEQKMAHERFTQINLAYEYLEEVMK